MKNTLTLLYLCYKRHQNGSQFIFPNNN